MCVNEHQSMVKRCDGVGTERLSESVSHHPCRAHTCSSSADSQLYHWDQMQLSIPLSLHTSTDALSTWSFFISAAVCKKGEREREVVCGQVWWPILGICPLHLTHPSAHSQQWTHTRSSGQPYCGARGAVGGSVPCSRVKWGNRCLAPPTTPAGPGNRTCNLWVTSPTL